MHRQIHPDKRVLLIGAPKAKALGNQEAKITGGLYKCELTQANDCERIDFDTEEDIRVENKEDQWMGVTVQSQGPGGKIVTCAHRYQRRLFVNTLQESLDITGRCYVLSQDLTIDTSSDEDGGNWNFCQGRARGHEMFGSCQQGLAAAFTKDYHYVVFGAPGAYNWKGIVRVEQKNNTFLEMGIYDDGPYEVGDENLLNSDLVPLPANSYLGFSLDSGHSIMRNRDLTVVAGAPRANHSGAVALLKKEVEGSTRLSVVHTLQGPGLGSSFGYDLAVVDLNRDGWQDIVAGHWDRVTPVRLNGTKDSMFGLAVKNIGDINQDHYEDIAVGAPFDDSGTGKVYIFHGSAQGINTTPAQVLSGKDHNIKYFGYSLAGNMDLDSNSYPDLAVGSLSDAAVIYRARPVISIWKDVKITPQEIDLTMKTCGNSVCFTVDACFSYRSNHASYSPRLTISYSVEADAARWAQGLPSRVLFLNKSSSENDLSIMALWSYDNIKDKMRSISIEVSSDIVGLKRQKSRNGIAQLMPILDPALTSKEISEVNFLKEGCGRDQICQSNLKMNYKLYYKQNNQGTFTPLPVKDGIPVFYQNYEKKDLAVKVTVNNMNGDDAYEAKLTGLFPDNLTYSGVRSQTEKQILCNTNQNGSQAECELGNPFKRDSETVLYILLSPAGLTSDTEEMDIDWSSKPVNFVSFRTSVQESIAFAIKVRVFIEVPLTVTGLVNTNTVHFGGTVTGESAMKTEEDMGSLIIYKFTINNLWKSSNPASLHIHWPKSAKNGKWLLYLVKITAKEGTKDIHCTPESEINPLKRIRESSSSRTKRETGERKIAERSADRRKVLSCEDGLKCVILKCPLEGLDGTTVELKSRLWNSTFLEDYISSTPLDIIVKASLVLHTSAKNTVLRTPDSNVTVTVYPETTITPYGGVPWWIILVAVLAGILILALLVFLLWKCGFFNRSKQEDTVAVPRYHAVRIRKESLEYKDGKVKFDALDKKQWMTTWINNESYS
ncbi:hypothetical protein WMY93_002895 [Mugilogobius chulae]|uniref:Integrin alpha-2 domain-containing protein n=1 Tax=Mugilogobius chulae TaxID=88201 RepID=A0AAW0Q607_9GOBI